MGSCPNDLSTVDEYEFATQAEADAFWKGVYAAEGWNGYTELEDDDVVLENSEGCLLLDKDGAIIINDAAGNRVERDMSTF